MVPLAAVVLAKPNLDGVLPVMVQLVVGAGAPRVLPVCRPATSVKVGHCLLRRDYRHSPLSASATQQQFTWPTKSPMLAGFRAVVDVLGP